MLEESPHTSLKQDPGFQGLTRLLIQHVRNIESADIQAFARINLFYGANGSGKTSVLEAIVFLATARSFRNAQIARFINHNQTLCTVFGEKQQEALKVTLGVSRDKSGARQAKVQGEAIPKLIDLAKHLPFQLIYYKTFEALSEGPSIRRQLLDWGVFHVEHDFKSHWLRLQRAVKQRNRLLRDGAPIKQLLPWNKELIQLAELIDKKREAHIRQLTPIFLSYLQRLLPEFNSEYFSFRYFKGWNKDDDYSQVLASAQEKDCIKGVTQYGPHRAHINVYLHNTPAADQLSRGQLKMLIIAFKLAQGKLLFRQQGVHCLYLIDDLPSELDEKHLDLVSQALIETKAQVFASCIEKRALKTLLNADNSRLFHVEHGKITPSNIANLEIEKTSS